MASDEMILQIFHQIELHVGHPRETNFYFSISNKNLSKSPLSEDKFISSLTLEMAKAYFTPNNPNSGRVLVGINNLEKFH